jgi:hypothetical protein
MPQAGEGGGGEDFGQPECRKPNSLVCRRPGIYQALECLRPTEEFEAVRKSLPSEEP